MAQYEMEDPHIFPKPAQKAQLQIGINDIAFFPKGSKGYGIWTTRFLLQERHDRISIQQDGTVMFMMCWRCIILPESLLEENVLFFLLGPHYLHPVYMCFLLMHEAKLNHWKNVCHFVFSLIFIEMFQICTNDAEIQ